MPDTDARSLSSIGIKPTKAFSSVSVDRLESRSNPNFARKSPIRSMVDFYKDDGLYFSANDTVVFWNFDDYPVTVSADYVSVRRNIKSALHQMGFYKLISIEAYSDKLRQDTSALEKAAILCTQEGCCFPNGSGYCSYHIIISNAYNDPVNVVVIAKQSPKSELNRVLHCLKSRNNPVLLVQPPDDTAQDSLFHSVDALVDCTHLLSGEKPISIRPQSSDSGTDADYEEDAFRWRKLYFVVE